MRRYDKYSGILFILSIIGFTLAAPVLVQEKRQACVDVPVVHIPKDVMTVLGKRGDEELEKLLEEYFNNVGKPAESSDAHALSSSAPPGPDHGSTNVVQAPAPNPASSTANPDPLMEPWGPSSSTAPKQSSWEDLLNAAWDDVFSNKGEDELHGPLYTPTSTEHGWNHELTGMHAPQWNPGKRPLTDSDPDFEDPQPPTRRPRPAPPEEFGPAQENQPEVEHVRQPTLGPSTDSDFEWNDWVDNESPTRRPAPPKEFGQAHENQVEDVQQPSPGPSTVPNFDRPKEFKFGQAEDELHEPLYTPTSTEQGWDHELTGAYAPQPNSGKGPFTDPDPDFEDPQPPTQRLRPAPPEEFGQAHAHAHENQVEHVQPSRVSVSQYKNYLIYDYPGPPRRPPNWMFHEEPASGLIYIKKPDPPDPPM